MRALDDIGRIECFERDCIRIVSDPQQRDQGVAAHPLGDEFAHGKLVAQDCIAWIEVEQLAPLNFFAETAGAQQAQFARLAAANIAAHPFDGVEPLRDATRRESFNTRPHNSTPRPDHCSAEPFGR
jgi:hypothetical protein